VGAIAAKPGVKQFATNPLLLTILALIHRNGTQLPQRRVELYELATKTLIEDWQLGRNVPYGVQYREQHVGQLALTEEEVMVLLAPLAFQMHEEKPSGLVEQEQVEAWLVPRMMELQGVDQGAALVLVRQFLRKVRETTGLFVERGPGVYGFMHLSFEEYFAARYIADHESKQVLKIIESKLSDSRWHEPISLTLSFLKNYFPKQTQDLIENLFKDFMELSSKLRPQHRLFYLASFKAYLLSLRIKLNRKNNSKTIQTSMAYAGNDLIDIVGSTTELGILGLSTKLFYFIVNQDHLKKIELGVQILEDAESNNLQNSKLFHGLLAAKIMIDGLNSGFKTMLLVFPEKRRNIQNAKKVSDQLIQKFNDIENQDLVYSGLEYLQLVTHNLLLQKDLRDSAQKIFLQIYSNDSARKSPEKNTDIVESLNRKLPEEHYAVAYVQAGNIYEQKDQYKEAIFYYQKGFVLYQKINQREEMAEQLVSIAMCYLYLNKYELALKAAQKSLTINKQIDNRIGIVLVYSHLGLVYQVWGRYEQAIEHFQQGKSLCQKPGFLLGLTPRIIAPLLFIVINQWLKVLRPRSEFRKLLLILQGYKFINIFDHCIASCYCDLGKYELSSAIAKDSLGTSKSLGEKAMIAHGFRHLGDIYKEWGKYQEATSNYQASFNLYIDLKMQEYMAESLYDLALCYRGSQDYLTAVTYLQDSLEKYQDLGDTQNTATQLRRLSNTQLEFARHLEKVEAIDILYQAQNSLQQAMDLDIAGDYSKNLAYDYISQALLAAEFLRWLSPDDPSFCQHIDQFEQSYATGFQYFDQLGWAINRAEAALNIARAYLEIPALENLDRAETLAQQSLQTFQEFNRRKLQAATYKLLGEIYLKQAQNQKPEAQAKAHHYLSESLQLYRDLDLSQSIQEVEDLLSQTLPENQA
jgi:tetratricopeptide (TPR) repeat protein